MIIIQTSSKGLHPTQNQYSDCFHYQAETEKSLYLLPGRQILLLRYQLPVEEDQQNSKMDLQGCCFVRSSVYLKFPLLEIFTASPTGAGVAMKSGCEWYIATERKKQGASCVEGSRVCREECQHHLCWGCWLRQFYVIHYRSQHSLKGCMIFASAIPIERN